MSEAHVQVSLGFYAKAEGLGVWQAELEWARAAVTSIGPKEAAHALGITPQALSDALRERVMPDGSKRQLKAEWIAVIRQLAPPELQQQWLRNVSRPLGHEPTPIQIKTPLEWKGSAIEWLALNCPFVLTAMLKEIGQ